MKTKLITGLMALLITIGIMSCKKDYLKKAPDEDLNLEKIFGERKYAEAFLTSVYASLPTMANVADDPTQNPFTGASDDMKITYLNAYSNLMNSGAWSADYSGPNIWGNMYEGIRKANIFLDNVDKVPMDATERTRWKGEVMFLRAYFHFLMARIHGPIPIADHTYTLDEDYSKIRRAPIDQVIGFIAAECDKAIPLLDYHVTSDNLGRITKVACLALKSQALLYMASPLWNGNPDYMGLRDNKGTVLFPSYDKERWRAAASAAKRCIDESEANGYKLFKTGADPVANFQQLFLVRNNEEVLLARNLSFNAHFERCSNPIGFGGYSIFCPTQEVVDDYEMANGVRPITGYNSDGSPVIDPASGYVETGYAQSDGPANRWSKDTRNMYVGREPRFYASINYNGALWKNRKIELWFTGLDGKSKAGSDYCISGYLQKKAVSPTSNIPGNVFSLNTFIYFRLGEQYLNYAEALNESDGPVSDVYKYMNALRNRAGLPNLPEGLSADDMRERIHHERRVELAFEAHRYFDCHRWKIAAQTDNREIHGMSISAGNNLKDDAFYKRVVIEKRVFVSPKHYLWPINQQEINKNPNLIQNSGW